MRNPIPHTIHGHTFWVSPDRCLYWEEENTLLVSDLHLGKSGHFRKEGIAVPQGIYKADLQRLIAQLYLFKADRLIIVGDMTHSRANRELDLFTRWRKDFSALEIELVRGNHDILDASWYSEANITVHEKKKSSGPFVFLHDLQARKKLEANEQGAYSFTGHMHPGISIRGKGRQALTFPCFYFAKDYCVLPAFSRFTGTFQVCPGEDETAFAIVDDALMKI
jgi:DNA ligase-associated metallophosphoesterase